ncbi:MAG: hypothetical protein SGARI_001039 [Bacillariaceae sp.]
MRKSREVATKADGPTKSVNNKLDAANVVKASSDTSHEQPLTKAAASKRNTAQVTSINSTLKSTNNVVPTKISNDLFIDYQFYPSHEKPYNLTFGPWTRCTLGVTYNKRGKKPIERE